MCDSVDANVRRLSDMYCAHEGSLLPHTRERVRFLLALANHAGLSPTARKMQNLLIRREIYKLTCMHDLFHRDELGSTIDATFNA